MKLSSKILIGLSIATISFSSCKKEGCTDNDATNFSEKAKKNDGSCQFSGKTVLWYGSNTSDSLYFNGSDAVIFYVDNEVVGSSDVSVFWTSSPECGTNGSITIEKNLGTEKLKNYSYKVVDDLGFTIWIGTLEIKANNCNDLELVY